jgi:hypothetical protein
MWVGARLSRGILAGIYDAESTVRIPFETHAAFKPTGSFDSGLTPSAQDDRF